jgi:hypothetical protein
MFLLQPLQGGLKHKTHSGYGIAFFNRSVKNLHLAALKDQENLHYTMAARWRFFTDHVFTHLKRKICDETFTAVRLIIVQPSL